ncbi:MAG: autotransporter domain-containing protein [Pseudomarimonas sp.]
MTFQPEAAAAADAAAAVAIANQPSISTREPRPVRLLRGMLLLLLLAVVSPAWALCTLAPGSSIGGAVFPGDSVGFDFLVGDDGGGCTGAQFRLVENLDTTGDAPGSFVSSALAGSAGFGESVFGAIEVSDRGGGAFGFLVICSAGCANTVDPQFAVLYTVDDRIDVQEFSGNGQATGPGSPFGDRVQLKVKRNGAGAASEVIEWTISPPSAATFAANGSSALNTQTDSNGIAFVDIIAGPVETSFTVRGCLQDTGCDLNASFDLNITNSRNISNTSPQGTIFVNQFNAVTVLVQNNGAPVPNGTPISFENDPKCDGLGDGTPLSTGTTSGGRLAFGFTPTSAGSLCRVVRWDVLGDTLPGSGQSGPPNSSDDAVLGVFLQVRDFYQILANEPAGGVAVISPGQSQNIRVDVQRNGDPDDTHVVTFSQTGGPAQLLGLPGGPITPSGGVVATSVSANVAGVYEIRARYRSDPRRDASQPVPLAPSSGELPVDTVFTITVRNQIIANADDFSGSPLDGQAGGATPSVHDNDSFNLAALSGSQVTTSILSDDGLGANITSGGVINVPAPQAAGTYQVVYQLCDVTDPANCVSGTATIVITAAAIVANDDNFVGSPTFVATVGGSTPSVYSNDTFAGRALMAADVTPSILNGGGMAGVTINASTGAIDLPPPPLPVGVFTISYQICEVLNPSNCDNANVQVDIANTTPSFSSTAPTSATEDLPYSYAITTTEPDSGDSVTITSVSTLPGWLTLTDNGNGTATLSGTPLNADVGVTPSIGLRVTDSIGASSTQAFTITVNDSNDAPTFTSVAPTAATQGVQFSYAITTADEDVGDTRTITSISTLPSWLALIDNGNGTATLSGTPNNADVGSHPVSLQVRDLLLATATQSFTIVVTDVNEAPVFGQSSYTFSLDENAASTTLVGSATATDPDVGQTLNYAITSNSSSAEFVINGTGQIRVQNGVGLDFESAPIVTLTVQVTDSAAIPLSTSVSVQINLNDLNEVPSIAGQSRSIAENSSNGSPVGAPLLASDVDAGANGTLSWSIIAGNAGAVFAIDDNGQLTVASQAAITLANSPFALLVQVQDGGGLTATAQVTVTVGDINDAPVFGQSSYSFAINENANAGSLVGAAVAIDVDAGQIVSYAITADSSNGLFAIDSNGQITLVSGTGLDFESNPSYALTVQATDNDASPLSTTATVQIALNDLNEVPTITAQTRSVAENSSAGTLVGAELAASDVDAGNNGALTWSILTGNSGGGFAIDANGQLFVVNQAAIALNNSPFSLQVQVRDGGGLTANAIVTVNVTDVATTLLLVAGDAQTALPGAALSSPLVVRAEDESAPAAGVMVDFSVVPPGAATVTPASSSSDSTGNVQASVQLSASAIPGSVIQISAARRDDPTARVVFSITVQAAAVVNTLRKPADSGDGQSAVLGSTLQPLRVLAENNAAPASGVAIQWSVSGPASLSAAQSISDAAGGASINVTLGNTPGAVVVTAVRADAPTAQVVFNLTALPAAQPTLRLVSGNGQSGLIGTRADAPIVVKLLGADGNPSAGQTIQWNVLTANATLDAAASITNAQGEAQIGFVFGAVAGSVQIRAAHAGSSLDVLSTHLATAATVSNVEGSNQTGTAGQPLPERFVINLAPALSKALGGARVDWQVLSGGGSLEADATFTDADGVTSNRLTLGVLGGENTVRAIVPGGQEILFTALGTAAPGSLVRVSGNDQTVPTTTASAPLVVQLRNATGQPVVGASIRWSADNATVEPATSLTDSNGRAQTIASVLLPGAATVTASTEAIQASPVVFAINGGVANIPTLDEEQQRTSDAVDLLCPALAALATRSAGEEDLFQRCLELVDNAGDNPDAVENALDQLPTDIGSTLSEVGTSTVVAQNNNFEQRFRQVRSEQPGASRNQLEIGFWTPDGALPLSFLPAAADEESAEGQDLGSAFSQLGFFATGQIGRGKFDRGQQSPEFEFDIGGLTAGVDYRFNDHWVAGVAVGFSDNTADLADDRGELDSRALSLTAFATWYNERSWYADGTLLVGHSNYDLLRRIRYSIPALDGSLTQVDQRATASTDGSQLGTTFSVGKDWQKGPWSLSGYLRGAYTRIETDAYEEQMLANLPGQGLALAVDSRSTRSTTTTLGSRATYILSRDWGILMPTASVEWEHEYQDDPGRLSARFLFDPAGATLTQEGDAIDTDYFNVSIGVSALFPGGKSAFLTYEELVGLERLRQGILSLGVRIEF